MSSTTRAPQFRIFDKKRKYLLKCLTWTRIKIWNMHTVFYEVFFIPDGILCYEVFERNDIIETKAVHFFKKVRWLSSKCFSTNYTERT